MGGCFACFVSKHREMVIARCNELCQKQITTTQLQLASLTRLSVGLDVKLRSILMDPYNAKLPLNKFHPAYAPQEELRRIQARIGGLQKTLGQLHAVVEGIAAADGSIDDDKMVGVVDNLRRVGINVDSIEDSAQNARLAADSMRELSDAANVELGTSGRDVEGDLRAAYERYASHTTTEHSSLLSSQRPASDETANTEPVPQPLSAIVEMLGT